MANYSNLVDQIDTQVECFTFDSIASTNDYLSALDFSSTTQICIASEQTQGKGQYDRSWLSQKDASILLSIRYVFKADLALNGLSLVIGLAIVDALEELGIKQAKLKWPNDLFIDHKKLAGILIENTLQGQYQSVVIGLGLNYNLSQNFECQSPWIDLAGIIPKLPPIENLSALFINYILKNCKLFASHGLSHFLQSWRQVDYLKNMRVELDLHNQTFMGIVKGINTQGMLMVEVNGQLIEVCSSKQIRLI
jgi:BirA family biotin operon repressor/biotin-[acetyl-CoA-carboxylase] ligase